MKIFFTLPLDGELSDPILYATAVDGPEKKRVWAVERLLFARITGSRPYDDKF
ncbi:hypothetical protein OH773_03115 [Buttiauxella sp. WJP83]|uniref:hypothetical protein n=1 Tax=Buttiauxella sp. WJP83 TaxID=2986951 RepID=UPI0022DD5EFA|nr:hypothetical protein [Buttiauxella sp. WJP83]WBM71271.1 hypothetical protein OH773_03115 [Buttiauxella sp. WJP83]